MDGQQVLNSTIITVKLTTHGKYIWSIVSNFPTDQSEEYLSKIKNIDHRLKDLFPDYIKSASSRTYKLEEEL